MSKIEKNMPGLRNSQSKKGIDQDPYVIGIGGSAGSLQALDSLFENSSFNSVAYVMAQHLSPENKHLLKEILSKHPWLHLCEAEDNRPVENNNVYFIPAGKQITIKKNHLMVTTCPMETANARIIDTFFKSLALDKGERCAGIILSGTGTDGTEGILALKKAKALVMVQDPETARFAGMPRSAINSGYVDLILPPAAMPDEIFNYLKVLPLTEKLSAQVTDYEPSFVQILNLVRECSGIDFIDYKRPTLIRRIGRRMAITNASTLVDYVDYLHRHPEEAEILSKEFLIGVTQFFRDHEAFEIIQKEVIPALVAPKIHSDQLRIWVAGCTSGEEAYSLAILIREHLDEVGKELEVKIFASDIDRDALDVARKARYSEESLRDVTKTRKRDFFVKDDHTYQVNVRIRRMVIFAPHNIVNDAPFSNIDLVTCRNMLIYLSPMLQKKAIIKFHYALNFGGFLVLGPSESIGTHNNFAEINKKWKIFRHIPESQFIEKENPGFIDIGYKLFEKPPVSLLPPAIFKLTHTQYLTEQLNEAILEEYGYAAVYVDENNLMVHGYGDYTRFLSLPNRAFTLNILKLVPSGLALPLGEMLRQATRNKERVLAPGILVQESEIQRYINITVKPVLEEKKTGQNLNLILFKETLRQELPPLSMQVYQKETLYSTRVTELETELQQVKEELQTAVEMVETVRKEFQSTNEELQSLNEELYTINSEHQAKNKLMQELDQDLNNYFRSTNIGQIFVDIDLTIRKFTPSISNQINLLEGEMGRSIPQISKNLNYASLAEDIEKVISTRNYLEREVQHKNGNWYQLRVHPYITLENKVDGALIIFISINELKNLQLLQESILDSSPNAIIALKAVRNNLHIIIDFECAVLNYQAKSLLNLVNHSSSGLLLSEAYPPLMHNGLLERYIKLVNEGDTLNLDHLQETAPGQKRWMHLTGVKMDDGLVLTIQDITSRRKYEQELLHHQAALMYSAERFRTLLEAVPHMTWTNKPTGENLSFNQAWYEYTGLTEAESVNWGWQKAFHPDDLKMILPAYEESLKTRSIFNAEGRILRKKDQQYRWHLFKNVPILDQSGQNYLWIGTATDIQDQKDAEKAAIKLKVGQQREILHTILKTQEAERLRISEALHNGLGQLLYATKLHLTEIRPTDIEQRTVKSQVENLVDEAISSTRQISFELTPSILKDFGLKTAIGELINRVSHPKLAITTELTDLKKYNKLDYIIEISLYRIIQELLNNIIKHAQATEAFVEITIEKNLLCLRVQDNGIGLKNNTTTLKGIGLNSINNRVKVLNGQLKIDSRPDHGTVFEIKCPLKVT